MNLTETTIAKCNALCDEWERNVKTLKDHELAFAKTVTDHPELSEGECTFALYVGAKFRVRIR